MRYAVVYKPDSEPYVDGKAIAKIEGSVATLYINNTALPNHEIRQASVVYEEGGVYLIESTIKSGSKADFYYENLLLPESHPYFNFGILFLKQGNGIDWSAATSLGEATSVMRDDLKSVFDHMKEKAYKKK